MIVRMNFTMLKIISFNRLIWNKQKEMGKLSKLLLKSIVFTALKAQNDPTFQVTSCNADVSSIILESLHVYIYMLATTFTQHKSATAISLSHFSSFRAATYHSHICGNVATSLPHPLCHWSRGSAFGRWDLDFRFWLSNRTQFSIFLEKVEKNRWDTLKTILDLNRYGTFSSFGSGHWHNFCL